MLKNTKNFRCLIFIFALAFIWKACLLCLAKENTSPKNELLILIDGSLSISEEQDAINTSLDLLYSWLEKEQNLQIKYMVFADDVYELNYENISNFKLQKSTHIAKGLEKANEIVMNAIERNSKIYVIVISDMVASQKGGYTWEDAIAEQEAIDTVISEWKELSKSNSMNYLFITWKSDNISSLQEIEKKYQKIKDENELISQKEKHLKKQDGFLYTISKRSSRNVYKIDKKNSTNQEKGLPITEVSGMLIKSTLQFLRGCDVKFPHPAVKRSNNLNIKANSEAYVIIDANTTIYQKGNATKEEQPLCSIPCLKLYHLSIGSGDEKYFLDSESASDSPECFLFYIPQPPGTISFNSLHQKTENDTTTTYIFA